MANDIFTRVSAWYCEGLPIMGLCDEERAEVIESALGSYLAEHVGSPEEELRAMDDTTLVASHYFAMVDASR